MPNDDHPLDLEDQPFADRLDAPQQGTEAAPARRRLPLDDSDWNDEPEVTPADTPRGVEDEWVRPSGQPNSLLMIVGALVLFMVLLVVFLAVNNDDDASTSSDPTTTVAAGLPAPGAPGAVPPPSTAPDPGSDPDLEVAETKTDDFQRPDGALGDYPGLGPWVNDVGALGIEKGSARPLVVAPDSNLLLSTIDVGSADVNVEVELPSPVDRAGLAFRVESPQSFLALFATSEYATYTLARFEDGKLESYLGNTDITGVQAGDVIGVRAKGSKVELLTNGTVRASFDDPELELAGTRVGMFAFLDDTGPKPIDARDFANWTNFKVLALTS